MKVISLSIQRLITVLIHPASLLWVNDLGTSYNNSKFPQGLKNTLKSVIQKKKILQYIMGHDWAIIPVHSLWLFFPILLHKLNNQLLGSLIFKWWQSKNVLKMYQWPTKLHCIYMLKFLWRFFFMSSCVLQTILQLEFMTQRDVLKTLAWTSGDL